MKALRVTLILSVLAATAWLMAQNTTAPAPAPSAAAANTTTPAAPANSTATASANSTAATPAPAPAIATATSTPAAPAAPATASATSTSATPTAPATVTASSTTPTPAATPTPTPTPAATPAPAIATATSTPAAPANSTAATPAPATATAPTPGPTPTPTPAPAVAPAVQVVAPANVTATPVTVTTTSDVFAPATKGADQIKQVTTSTPAMQINFPSSAGNATIQYPTQPTAPTTATQQSETISVDFPNEEIRTILRNVADLYELNLVIPESLTGTASVKLRNVTWQQVFQVVLEPIGFTYAIDNNIIKIKSRAELQTEPVETRVFLINSARANELINSLSPLVDNAAGGRIQVDNRTNALIITERPSRMNNIQEIIDRLDRPTQQVSIETKFIELSVNNSRDLGITWNFNNTTLGTASYAWQYNIAHGLGVLQNSGTFPLLQQGANGPANLNEPIPVPNPFSPSEARRAADLAFFNQAQYTAVLQALQLNTNARLVSSPTVVTLDNEEISFYFGTTVNFIYPTINNQTGQALPGDHQEKEVGIKMRVKPQVSNNGFINLTLNPEVSRLSPESDTFPISGTSESISYPRIDTRKLTDAKISVKDGYTLGLSGLIDDEDQVTVNSVPILGDIPLLGELFKSTSTIKVRNNLIIFVTAKTLSPDGATYRDVIDPNLMLRTDVTADEIPGFYDRSHPGVPGVARVTDAQLKEMQDVQAARDQSEQEKLMKLYKKEIKDAQEEETSHLGK